MFVLCDNISFSSDQHSLIFKRQLVLPVSQKIKINPLEIKKRKYYEKYENSSKSEKSN